MDASSHSRDDQRRFERFKAETLDIDCEVCGQAGARLTDIGIGGAGITLRTPLKVGAHCMLDISRPEGSFSIMSRIIWLDEMPAGSCGAETLTYKTGVCFDDSSSEESRGLIFSILNSN